MQDEMFADQPFLFVVPIITKLLKDGTAKAEDFLPLDCKAKSLVFFALNNHEGSYQGGTR